MKYRNFRESRVVVNIFISLVVVFSLLLLATPFIVKYSLAFFNIKPTLKKVHLGLYTVLNSIIIGFIFSIITLYVHNNAVIVFWMIITLFSIGLLNNFVMKFLFDKDYQKITPFEKEYFLSIFLLGFFASWFLFCVTILLQ